MFGAGEFHDRNVCQNDPVVVDVYRAYRIHAPEASSAVRVISHDDVGAASLWEPPFTTVAASGHEVGLRCAEVLLGRIADHNGPPERSLIRSDLVIRESCGCHPTA